MNIHAPSTSQRTTHTSQRGRHTLLMLGLVSVLLDASGCMRARITPDVQIAQTPGRLTVRPSMATGTETRDPGVHRLDALYPGDSLLAGAVIYVPQRCVGTTRFPLVILLQGALQGWGGINSIEGDSGLFKHYADSLGYILLAPAGNSTVWDFDFDRANSRDLPRIEAPIRTVLQHYAINPKRLILMGGSAGAGGALALGYVNGDVFSHVVGFEGWVGFGGERQFSRFQSYGRTKFFFAMSKDSTEEEMAPVFPTFVEWLRKKGYQIDYVLDNGDHGMTPARGNLGFDWLAKNGAWR